MSMGSEVSARNGYANPVFLVPDRARGTPRLKLRRRGDGKASEASHHLDVEQWEESLGLDGGYGSRDQQVDR
jgi:hypothetical protein